MIDIVKVPGIPPSAALLVYAVGYIDLAQLKERDPLDMYDSVLERLAIRSTDCRLLTRARSNELKKEINALGNLPEEDRGAMLILADKLSNEIFGREKRQALINGLRLASWYATFGPQHDKETATNSLDEMTMHRYLAMAHLTTKDLQTWSPKEVYNQIFWSMDLVPVTVEMVRASLGLTSKL
jgi:hypothetical protein